jgi:hypothetical protein
MARGAKAAVLMAGEDHLVAGVVLVRREDPEEVRMVLVARGSGPAKESRVGRKTIVHLATQRGEEVSENLAVKQAANGVVNLLVAKQKIASKQELLA